MKPQFGISLFFMLAITTLSAAQSLQRVAVGKSGVSIGSSCKMSFDVSKSKDSSIVYNGECSNDGVTYGVICVKLLSPILDMDDAESVASDYLDYLHNSYNITHAEGFKKGLRLNKDENTRGINDQWGDAQKNVWMVRAWTNGKFITVVYANSKKPLVAAKIDAFLNSVRFPN
jgi:hypothetical protein